MKGLNLGDTFPDVTVSTTDGSLKLHEYFGNSWGILFSHPADYTPVCTTELARVIQLVPEFSKRNVKLIALSCNSVDDHRVWLKDIQSYSKTGGTFPYPIIADPDRELAKKFGMLDPNEVDMSKMPVTCRAVFIIGPDKKLKLSILYPATTGRNFKEIIRVIDSLQLTATKSVATPVDWNHGDKCMVVPSLSDEAAKAKFPRGFTTERMPSGRGYMRFTDDPSDTDTTEL